MPILGIDDAIDRLVDCGYQIHQVTFGFGEEVESVPGEGECTGTSMEVCGTNLCEDTVTITVIYDPTVH